MNTRIFSRRTLLRSSLFAIAAGMTLGWGSVPADAQNNLPFTVTDLGQVDTLGGLNNKADVSVVGSRFGRGFVFRPSIGFRDMTFSNTNAIGVNTTSFTADTIVGTQGVTAAFLFPDFGQTSPISLAHASSNFGIFIGDTPLAINDSSVSVGMTQIVVNDGADTVLPTRWTPTTGAGTTVTLLNTGGNIPGTSIPKPGVARDINNVGVIVGQANGQACIFRDGQTPVILTSSISGIPLTPGAILTEARGISNNGFITGIGSFLTQFGRQTRGFIWVQSSVVNFQTLIPNPGFPLPTGQFFHFFVGSVTNKINSNGHAVGAVVQSNGATNASMWNLSGNGIIELTAACGLHNGILTEAVDINDQGDVLCLGVINGVRHGFLLRRTATVITFSTTNLY